MEIEVGRETDVLGHSVTTTEVVHYSGAPSTALRLSDGKTLFAYSGDTEWVEACVASPTAPISSSSSATAIPAICRATSAGKFSSRGCPICARGGSC